MNTRNHPPVNIDPEMIRAEGHNVLQGSHVERTAAGREYYKNRPQIVEGLKAQGVEQPGKVAGMQQKQVVEQGISNAHNSWDAFIDRTFGIERDHTMNHGPNQNGSMHGGAAVQQPQQQQGNMSGSFQDSRRIVNDLQQHGGQMEIQNGRYTHSYDQRPGGDQKPAAERPAGERATPDQNHEPAEQSVSQDHGYGHGR